MSAKRDSKGRFVKGNKASPGRKPREVERDYMTETISRVSVRDWGQVVAKALEQSKDGDQAARRFLADYVLGRPPQILELRGAEALTLQQLLLMAKDRGLSAGTLFEAMIAEIAEVASTGDVDALAAGDEDDE